MGRPPHANRFAEDFRRLCEVIDEHLDTMKKDYQIHRIDYYRVQSVEM